MKHIKKTWADFEFEIHVLAEKILSSRIQISSIYGIARGGLIIAVRLSHLLEKSLVTNPIYADKNTLWVDDVVETGKTLINVHDNKLNIASLYWNPNASFKPLIFAFRKIDDEWLDFAWEDK